MLSFESRVSYFQSKVGTSLKVINNGSGFSGISIGKSFKVFSYSPTGYNGSEGYLCVKGTNEGYDDWVGVKSFFNLDSQGGVYE
jgi:hypothetical protein